jgi:hypothetical protein
VTSIAPRMAHNSTGGLSCPNKELCTVASGIVVGMRLASSAKQPWSASICKSIQSEPSPRKRTPLRRPKSKDHLSVLTNSSGGSNVLFNNAGLNDRNDHSVLAMSLETWQRAFAANLTATFLCCNHGIPYLLKNDPPGGWGIHSASCLAVMGALRGAARLGSVAVRAICCELRRQRHAGRADANLGSRAKQRYRCAAHAD